MQKIFSSIFFVFCLNIWANTTVTDTIKTDTTALKFTETKVDTINLEEKTTFYKEAVKASYYADKFHGRRTASGTKFHNYKLTAAHKSLPFGTKIKVTNPENCKFVIVEITDRGPFTKGREIDLSKKAFKEITHHLGAGVIKVDLEIVETPTDTISKS